MKTITSYGDKTNKVNDTSATLKFYIWNDGVPQDITGKNVQATIANSDGFLFNVPMEINGYELSLDFSNENLRQLKAGDYYMEIKVTDTKDEVEIYPTNGAMSFTVTQDLTERESDLLPIVTFDALLKAVDQKIENYLKTIAKGNPGDKGDPGDNGLISKPLPTNNFNQVIANIKDYVGNWYIKTTAENSGVINGYPTDDMGVWVFQITSFSNSFGVIKANFNDSNKNFVGAVNNNKLVNWIAIQDTNANYVFDHDVTVNGSIIANSITSTVGNYTVRTDYMGSY